MCIYTNGYLECYGIGAFRVENLWHLKHNIWSTRRRSEILLSARPVFTPDNIWHVRVIISLSSPSSERALSDARLAFLTRVQEQTLFWLQSWQWPRVAFRSTTSPVSVLSKNTPPAWGSTGVWRRCDTRGNMSYGPAPVLNNCTKSYITHL